LVGTISGVYGSTTLYFAISDIFGPSSAGTTAMSLKVSTANDYNTLPSGCPGRQSTVVGATENVNLYGNSAFDLACT
jgi:hypothetical protein